MDRWATEYLQFLREGKTTLVQSELNREVKERKRMQRQRRVIAKPQPKLDTGRRQKAAAEIAGGGESDSASSQKKEEGV